MDIGMPLAALATGARAAFPMPQLPQPPSPFGDNQGFGPPALPMPALPQPMGFGQPIARRKRKQLGYGDLLPDEAPVTEAEKQGRLRQLGRGALSGLVMAGSAFDLPGSMVRDALVGANPWDQLLSPLSPENRATGRDVLRHYDLAGKEDTWGNFFGGLATEVATDPTALLTLGANKALTPAGQLIKRAGLLDDVTDAARALKRSAIASEEMAKPMGQTTLQQAMHSASGDLGKMADDLGKANNNVRMAKVDFTSAKRAHDKGVKDGAPDLLQLKSSMIAKESILKGERAKRDALKNALQLKREEVGGYSSRAADIHRMAASEADKIGWRQARRESKLGELIGQMQQPRYAATSAADPAATSVAQRLEEAAKSMGYQDLGEFTKKYGDTPLAKAWGVTLPQWLPLPKWTGLSHDPLRAFDIPWLSARNARAMDRHGPLAMFDIFNVFDWVDAIPGVKPAVNYLGRLGKSAFYAPAMGRITTRGQQAGEQAFRGMERAENLSRSSHFERASRAYEAATAGKSGPQGSLLEQQSQRMRRALEGVDQPPSIQPVTNRFGTAADPTGITREIADDFRKQHEMAAWEGAPTGAMLSDDVADFTIQNGKRVAPASQSDYLVKKVVDANGNEVIQRVPIPATKKLNYAGRRSLQVDDSPDWLETPRDEAYRGATEGTEGINKIARDPSIATTLKDASLTDSAKVKAIAEYIRNAYTYEGAQSSAKRWDIDGPPDLVDQYVVTTKQGYAKRKGEKSPFILEKPTRNGKTPDQYDAEILEWQQAWKEAIESGKVEVRSRAYDLARKLVADGPDALEHGIFPRHTIIDAGQRLEHQATSTAHHTATLDALAQEISVLPTGAKPGPDTMSVKEILDGVKARSVQEVERDVVPIEGFNGVNQIVVTGRALDEYSGATAAIARRLGLIPKDQKTIPRSLHRMIEKMQVSRDIGKDLIKGYDQWVTPDSVNRMTKLYDSYTALWKAGVLTRPSRWVRDWASGMMANVDNDMVTLPDMGRAMFAVQGSVIKGASKYPAIRKILQQAGLNVNSDSEATRVLLSMFEAMRSQGNYEWFAKDQGAASMAPYAATSLEDVYRMIPGADRTDKKIRGYKGVEKSIAELMGIATGIRPAKGMENASVWQRFNPLNVRGVYGKDGAMKHHTGFGPAAASERIGWWTDSMVRLAPFVNLLRRGWEPVEAMRHINNTQVMYSPKHFTGIERQWMRRLFPFYSFTSRRFPYVWEEMTGAPGGRMAQQVKTASRQQNPDDFTPEHVASSASVRLPITSPDERKYYLTNLGLMWEDPFQFFGGGSPTTRKGLEANVQNFAMETLSRMGSVPKAFVELGTKESTFQKGQWGGRPLDEMDPVVGRILTNLRERRTGEDIREARPFLGSGLLEYLAANSPASGALRIASQLTDKDRPASVKAMNLLTGARVTGVTPDAELREIRRLSDEASKEIGGKTLIKSYIPKRQQYQLWLEDPKKYQAARTLLALQKENEERSKARAAQLRQEEIRKIIESQMGGRR